jgi:hypothetical protein
MFGALHNREISSPNALLNPALGNFEYGKLIRGGYVSVMA